MISSFEKSSGLRAARGLVLVSKVREGDLTDDDAVLMWLVMD